MKKYFLHLLLLIFALTGCGGGGSPTPGTNAAGTSPAVVENVFATPASIPADKFRFTKIDYRYDTALSNKDINGYHTTSYESVKPMIDKIKLIGFTHVIFNLQTSINKNTGKVSYYDQPDTDKRPPKDLWKVVDYANSQGLKVWLSLQIVDSVTDTFLATDFTKYTEQEMFNSIIGFQTEIAKVAEQHKVFGIFISEGNYNLESYDHLFYWQQLISELRKVFSGKLSYTTYLMEPTSIWNHVDYASIWLNNTLSKTPIYDLKSIVNLYHNDIYNINEVQRIKDFHMVYGKKFILSLSPSLADDGVNSTPEHFLDSMVTGVFTSQTLPYRIDKQMQLLKISAFMEMIARDLINVTDAVGVDGFAPWLTHVGFSEPSDVVYKNYCCGWTINEHIDAQKTINYYFSKPWGYKSIQ